MDFSSFCQLIVEQGKINTYIIYIFSYLKSNSLLEISEICISVIISLDMSLELGCITSSITFYGVLIDECLACYSVSLLFSLRNLVLNLPYNLER